MTISTRCFGSTIAPATKACSIWPGCFISKGMTGEPNLPVFDIRAKTDRAILKHRPVVNPPDEAMQTHGVNNAMALKASPLWFLLTGRSKDRAALDRQLAELNRFHGLANGMFSSDEHFAGPDPSQGTELCTVVEEMFSLEEASPFWAIRCLPTDWRKSPTTPCRRLFPMTCGHTNTINSLTRSRARALGAGWSTNGDDSNLFGLEPNFGCCTANLHQGWPKFVSSLWMGTNDGGFVAVAYAPSQFKTSCGWSGRHHR